MRKFRNIKKWFLALIVLIMILSVNLSIPIKDHKPNGKKEELHYSAIPIGFGETISGSIDYAGEIDNYTFSATLGDTVLIRMGIVSGSTIDPELQLFSPSATPLSSSWGSLATEITYTLPETGVYKIEARDHIIATGPYCIYIQRVNNPGNFTFINFGDIIFGSINYASEADTYTFSANMGDSVLIKMGRVSGASFEQELRLYSPTGSLLDLDADFGYAAEIFHTLPQSGFYTILTCENDDIDFGTYNLFIQRTNNPGNAIAADLGNTISAAIGLPGESDTYTFSANAGEAILVKMGEISGTNFNPQVRLYSPTGAELTRHSGNLYTEMSYTLPQNGNYLVFAEDREGLDIGTYSITIQIINNPENDVHIAFGITVFGAIDFPTEFNTYTFNAYTNDVIQVWMSRDSGFDFESEMRLYSPTGTQLAQVHNAFSAAQIFHTLPQDGQYTIVTCDYGSIYPGSYYLHLQRVNNPGNSSSIGIGYTTSKSIELPSEVDAYTFVANAGETILIRMSEVLVGAFDPQLRLYSPSGIELAQNTNAYSAELSYTIGQDGRYTILARDSSGFNVGSYCISFQSINNPGSPIPIIYGSSIFGSINLPGEIDTYTFSANSGDSIFIRMGRASGSNFEPEIRLYSPIGTELIMRYGSTFSAEILYTLPQDGVYIIIACEHDSVDTGSYYLFIQRMNNPLDSIFVEFGKQGVSIIDSIESANDVDTFTFYGTLGDVVTIRMTELPAPSFDPQIRLYSPNGTELAQHYDYYIAQIYQYTLHQDGIFAVLACETGGNGVGSYELFFQFPYKIYNPSEDQDNSFIATTYEDSFAIFKALTLDLRFSILEPKPDMLSFISTLESWGINFYDFDNVVSCFLIEIGDFYDIFNYLESKIPDFLTSLLRENLEQYLSNDGYFRFIITTMNNWGDFENDIFEELIKFLAKIRVHQVSYEMPTTLFRVFENIIRIFFRTLGGSNQHQMKIALKTEFLLANKIDLIAEILIHFFESFNVAGHLLRVDDYSISASLICESKALVDAAVMIFHTFMLVFKANLAFAQGGLNPIATANFIARGITFIFDYYFNYEAGRNRWADVVYFIADFIDPPVARLDLQVRNMTSNQILLGHDESSNTTHYYCDYGFFTGDLESQFAVIKSDVFPVNVCIVNTHLDPYQDLIYLNQTLFFGETTTGSYSQIFSSLRSNQSISTIMDYSITEGLVYDQLNLNLIEQGETWVRVNVTNTDGSLVPDPTLTIFFHDNPIEANITELGTGLYDIVLDGSYTGKEIIVVAEKSEYLPDSIILLLITLEPLEELPEKSMFERLLPVIIVVLSILGLIISLEILHQKNLLKFRKRKKV